MSIITRCPLNIQIEDYKGTILIDGMTIRRIEEAERKEIFGAECIDGAIRVTNESYRKWDFEDLSYDKGRFFALPFQIQFNYENTFDDIDHLLLALKLYKGRDIWAPVTFNDAIYRSSNIICKDFEPYKIKVSEFDDVKELYQLVKKALKNNLFKICLERYKFAVSGMLLEENAYIELVSIMESLFLDNSTQEVSFRFALIVSYVLANELKVEKSFKDVKKIYTVRSQLVHGGKSSDFDKNQISSLKQLVGQLIIWRIKSEKDYKKIEKSLFDTLKIKH